MPDLQGLFFFPGIKQIISGDYVLQHGITPGVAGITIAPQATFEAPDGDLEITYGSTAVVMPNCRLQSHTFEYNERGLIWRLAIYDQRWKWRYGGPLTGAYNLRRHVPGRWDDTLDRSTEMAPQDLMRLCLFAMGEDDYDVSQVPNAPRPEIHWDHDNAAQALASLAELLGCRVILKVGGRVTVEPVGIGAVLVAIPAMIQESLSISPPTMPDSITAVCGPTRYQADFTLEACGLDVNGQVLPINQLSYTPKLGWGAAAGGCPQSRFSDVTDGVARELAQATVFRWYRIAPQPLGLDGKPLIIPGFNGPIKVKEQVLPIEDVQVETFTDVNLVNQVQPNDVAVPVTERVPKSKPALVWGFRKPRTLVPDNKNNIVTPALSQRSGSSLVPSSTAPLATMPPSRYTIDRQNGIVKFHDYEYILIHRAANSYKAVPSILALRCACSIRDPAGKVPDRYEIVRPLPIQNPSFVGTRILKHEEIQLNVWASRPGIDNSIQGVFTTKANGILPGSPGVDVQLNYYIDAAQAEYQVNAPYSMLYAGILSINPDGAIQAVHWTVDQSGAFTRAARNGEMQFTTISYQERRFWESVRKEDIDALKNKLRQDGEDAA